MSRYQDLLNLRFPRTEQYYTERDTMLYALGVGAADPAIDWQELRYVYEKDLLSLPTMAVTLAYPGFWYRDLPVGLDFVKTLHASERFELHARLPVAARVSAQPRVVAIYDKGPAKGALVVSERMIRDETTGRALATVRQTVLCRGDGGLGGKLLPAPPPHRLPDRNPDQSVVLKISPRAALIYRLSGDYNPLHVDPTRAREAGFERPILHGLSTYGYVGRAILAAFCRKGNKTIGIMDCRFVGVVLPGDNLDILLWRDGDKVSFRASVDGKAAIDNGFAILDELA